MARKAKKIVKKAAVKKVVPPLPRTARQMLDLIDRFLKGRRAGWDSEARKLWDVLTALRGPDSGDRSRIKDVTTIHIRRAAFPRLVKTYAYGLPASFSTSEPFRMYPKGSSQHFDSHIRKAAEALGLDVTGKGLVL